MEIELLVQSIMGLVVVFVGLMFLFFYSPDSKKSKKVKKSTVKKSSPQKQKTDLDSLKIVIKNKRSTSRELKEALSLILKHHGRVHKKIGARSHPDFDIYMDILFRICRHPNINKDIIVNFDTELTRLNPAYKAEINDAITKGLNSR